MEEKAKRGLRFRRRVTVGMRLPVFLLLLAFGLIPMVLCAQTLIGSMRQRAIESRMIETKAQCQILASKMTQMRYFWDDEKKKALNSEIETAADVYSGRIVVVDRDFCIVQDTFHVSEGRLLVAEEILNCFGGSNSSRYNSGKHYYIQTFPVYENLDSDGIDGVLLLTSSTESILDQLEKAQDKALFFYLMALLVIVASGFLLSGVLVRPFRELLRRLEHVAMGDLNTELSVDSYRETKEISGTVEKTIARLKAMDESRQEFVSNVSHELKTPITSVRVLADSLMGMESVPVELYQEFMEDISHEVDREAQIIDDLLALVKMDKSNAELNISQTDVIVLVKQILKRLRPIANRRQVELIQETIREVTAEVDEVKLSLAVSNLVENAVKYNRENGWVRVTVDADHKFFYIKVADSGIGIPEDEQNKIFDRFYRVDKARSRETGGSGLGLAITRNVVLMHKGAIRVSSKAGEGSTFTIRIPLKYIP